MGDDQSYQLTERFHELEAELRLLKQENRDFNERIDRLIKQRTTERSVRIVLILAVVFTIVAGRSFTAGSKTIEAEWFVLKDKAGATRANLGMNPDGVPALTLFDQSMRCRCSLQIKADGTPALAFFDRDNRNTIQLYQRSPNNRPLLEFRDEGGDQRLALALMGDGTPLICMGNKDWTDDVQFGMKADGSSFLNFTKGEDLRLGLGVQHDGTSSLELFDAGRAGSRSIEMSVNPNLPPRMETYDRSHRFEFPARDSSSPSPN